MKNRGCTIDFDSFRPGLNALRREFELPAQKADAFDILASVLFHKYTLDDACWIEAREPQEPGLIRGQDRSFLEAMGRALFSLGDNEKMGNRFMLCAYLFIKKAYHCIPSELVEAWSEIGSWEPQ